MTPAAALADGLPGADDAALKVLGARHAGRTRGKVTLCITIEDAQADSPRLLLRHERDGDDTGSHCGGSVSLEWTSKDGFRCD